MTKKDKKKALKKAFTQALEIINFYKGKSLEELEEMDTSELTCLGSFFNWLPNSGYEYSEEQASEDIAYYCERADHREERKERFYCVSFFEEGQERAKVRVLVSFKGLHDKNKALSQVIAKYPEYKDLRAKVETLSKAEYIASH